MNLFLNFLNNSFLNKTYVFFLFRKMIRAQFQIRCSFKNGTMFHHSRKFPNTQQFCTKTSRHVYRLQSRLFEKKAWTSYMIFRYTHVSKVFCHAGENFRLRGDSIVFAHKSLISAESTESCFLPVAHSFIFLVGQNRSIGINTARLDDEEKVYVVNFES